MDIQSGASAPVGRDDEVRQLAHDLATVAGGAFRAVAIDGEPGIGKTRLLDETAARARDLGFTVLRGTAGEFEQDLPFGVYLDAFASLTANGPADGVTAPRTVIDVLLPHAAASAIRPVDRYQLHRAIGQTLADEAIKRPIALILDDLHWADPATVELTEHLLRRASNSSGLLIALAYRRSGASRRLTDAVVHLGTIGRRLHLAPLKLAAIAQLAPSANDRRHQLLYQASRGNPLYLQVLREASDQELVALSGGPGTPHDGPTEPLLGLFRAELETLTEPLRAVLDAVAIAGDEASIGIIAAIASSDEPHVADALDRLGRAGLVTPSAGRFRLRHPLLRSAAYWTAPAGWRLGAHARAATYLRDRNGPLALLAHHVEQSAQDGDEAAAMILRDAAQALMSTAPASAANFLRTAVRVLPDSPEFSEVRLSLRMALARALGVTGELAESRRMLDELIGIPGRHRGSAIAFSSVISRLRGDCDQARALLANELMAETPDRHSTAQLLAGLAAVENLRGDPASARGFASRAVEMVLGSGDRALESASQTLLALSLLRTGEIDVVREHSARAAWLLDAATDDVLTPYIEMVAPLAWVETELGEHEQASVHLERGISLAHRGGLSLALPYMLVVDSMRRAWRGELVDAMAAAETASDISRSMQSREGDAMAYAAMLRPTMWRQGEKAALDVADRLQEQGLPRSEWWAGLARVRLAEIYVAAGRPELALAELARMPRHHDQPDLAVDGLAIRAVASDAVGDPDAERYATEALDHAVKTGLPHHLGTAHYAHARVSFAQNRSSVALDHSEQAVRGFAAAGRPVEEAQARRLLADLHSVTGAVAVARIELTKAKELFLRCGATWLGSQTLRTEARLAARVPRSTRTTGTADIGLSTLTEREREVAELAGSGHTNRDIADRLHVSQKTVEAHLSRVFAKLDVHSRVGLTRRLVVDHDR